MKRINLGVSSMHGVQLSAHEAIAVLHQVCDLLRRLAERGHAIEPPALHELFVSDEGDVEIDPLHESSGSSTGRSLKPLIDELLPPDRTDSEKKSRTDADAYAAFQTFERRHRHIPSPTTDLAEERDVLREFFNRVQREAGASMRGAPASTVVDSDETPTADVLAPDELSAIVFAADSDVAFADEVEESARSASDPQAQALLQDSTHRADNPVVHFVPSGSDLPRSDEPRSDEPRSDRPRSDRPRSDRPRSDRPRSDQATSEPRSDRHRPDKSRSEASRSDQARSDQARSDQARSGHSAPPLADNDYDGREVPGADALVDAWAPAERQPRVRPLAATAVLLYVTVGLFIAAMGAYPAFREKLLATIPFERESPALDIPEGAGRTAAQPEAPDGQDKSTVVERDAPPTQVVPASSNASTASSLEARLDERADVPASLPVTAADMAALRRDHALDPSGAFAGGRFSPDGRLVAFADDRGGEARGIYIAHRDGSDTMRVSGAGRAAAPRWSPDNGRLAFVRTEPERPAVWNLWVYRVRTGELRRLSSHASGVVRAATWFPNGEQLCYGHDRSLRIVNVTTGRTRSFASPLAGRAIGQSAVSPDGRRVAFALERDGVWLLDVETGRMRRVVEDAGATDDVSWAGRGGRLLYYSLSGRGEGAWRAAVTTVAGGAPISGSGVVSRDPGRK